MAVLFLVGLSQAAQANQKCPQEFSFLRATEFNGSQAASVSRTVRVEYRSRALGGKARVNFTLPPGFPSPGRRVPATFFLHGRGGQDVQEGYFSSVNGEADIDELLKSGSCRVPFIVISPYDDRKSYWREGPKSGRHLGTESLITKELFEILRACGAETVDLKIKPAIGGISAGGNGALYYGEKYSGLFGQVYALSPVFRGDDDRTLEPEDRIAFGKGQDFCEQDIVCRYKKRPAVAGACPYPVSRFKVEIAKDDAFYVGTGGIPPQVTRTTRDFLGRMRNDCPDNVLPPNLSGGHTEAFFRPGVKRMLSYFCDGFASPGSSPPQPGRQPKTAP